MESTKKVRKGRKGSAPSDHSWETTHTYILYSEILAQRARGWPWRAGCYIVGNRRPKKHPASLVEVTLVEVTLPTPPARPGVVRGA